MSCWTHITACLSVETEMLRKKPELKREIQKIIRQGPKITGSERNADIFVNIPSGYNWFISYDCEHCKYKETLRTITIDGKKGQECDAPDNYNCSSEYQSCVVISIQGDLRDRAFNRTKEEFEKFLEYVKDKFHVRDYTYNIEGE